MRAALAVALVAACRSASPPPPPSPDAPPCSPTVSVGCELRSCAVACPDSLCDWPLYERAPDGTYEYSICLLSYEHCIDPTKLGEPCPL